MNYYEMIRGMVCDASGDIILVGLSSNGIFPATENGCMTVKFDSNGNLIWAQRYSGIVPAYSILLDSQGNTFVSGSNFSTVLLKYDTNGHLVDIGYHSNSTVKKMAVDDCDNIILMVFDESSRIHVLKYDNDCNLIWDTLLPAAVYYPFYHDLEIRNSKIFLTGGTYSDLFTACVDSSGDILWYNFYEGTPQYNYAGKALTVDNENNVYVAGWRGLLAGYNPDCMTVKYDSCGNIVWIQYYDYICEDMARDVEIDSNENVYVFGYSKGSSQYLNEDYITIKYSQQPINWPPQISSYSPASNDTIDQNAVILFSAFATDPDLDSLLWTWTYDDSLVSTDTACVITFDELGEHTVMVRVSDGELADSVVWNVVVVPPAAVGDSRPARPADYGLSVSPNPFNPSTAVSYELRASSYVSLRAYDTSGREVATLVDGWKKAGVHEVTFDASGLPSGIYLARLTAGDVTQVQKLVLLK